MNPTLMDQFSEACGAKGPLIIDVFDDGLTHQARRYFHQPFLLTGRHPEADLELRHEQIRRRHCYWQIVGGQLFGIDLGGRGGIRIDGRPCRMAWTDRSREVRIGPVGMILRGGDSGAEAPPFDAPSPLSARYAREHPLPGATLEIASAGTEAHRWRMSRVLVLIGRAPSCKLKLISPLVSEIHCALLRTPSGVWLIDLLSQGGVYVDGARTNVRRLDEGAELSIGPFSIRLRYESGLTARDTRRLSEFRPGQPVSSPAAHRTAASDLPPALEPDDDPAGSMPEQLRQVLLMTKTIGAMHRDQMDVVREEHEAICRLADEIYALRLELSAHSGSDRLTTARRSGDLPPRANGRPGEFDPSFRKDPHELQAIASQFLSAYRHQQGSLRERILRVLLGSSSRVESGSRA